MASAFAFGNSSASEELNIKFEEWLSQKLKSTNNDKDADVSIFISYIVSTLSEEDNSEEEKFDAIRPILQELNEVKIELFEIFNTESSNFLDECMLIFYRVPLLTWKTCSTK